MKVLFLTNLPAPYRVDFFSELGKYIDLTVIYERDSASCRNEKWKSKSKKNYKEIFLKSKKIGDDNSISFEIIKYLKKEKYEHIIIGQYSTYTAMIAILYLKLTKIPFIISSDGGFVKENENRIKFKLKHFMISSANYWLSTGNFTNEYFIHYGANSDRIYKYPFTSVKEDNIISNKNLIEEKNKYKNIIELKSNAKMVLYVGQFINRKGIDILIKATSNFDNNIVVYAIGGKLTEEYKSLINKLNIKNIKFIDFMEKEKLLNYYKAADLFIFPTRNDIWGLVVNEALAAGVPVITSKNCGAGIELIKNDYNGFLINDNENNEEYANKINEYCNNEELLQTMSNNCLNTIKDYTIENMALRTNAILNNIKY